MSATTGEILGASLKVEFSDRNFAVRHVPGEGNKLGVQQILSLDEFLDPMREQPRWRMFFDFDRAASEEKVAWSPSKMPPLRVPGFKDRYLVLLDRKDGGVSEWREVDIESQSIVSEGFSGSGAKLFPGRKIQHAVMINQDEVLFLESQQGDDNVSPGMSRVARLWRRGEPVYKSQIVFTDIEGRGIFLREVINRFDRRIFLVRQLKEGHYEFFEFRSGEPFGSPLKIPTSSHLVVLNQSSAVVRLTRPQKWSGVEYQKNDIVLIRNLESGEEEPKGELIFRCHSRQWMKLATGAGDRVYILVTENVSNKIFEIQIHGDDRKHEILDLPVPPHSQASLRYYPGTLEEEPRLVMQVTSHSTPYAVVEIVPEANGLYRMLPVRVHVGNVDPSSIVVKQFIATSRDGTAVPYYVIHRRGETLNQDTPALIYAYGGFGISQEPKYLWNNLTEWVLKGGVYVVANVRGGREFGPEWHTSALGPNYYRTIEDGIAVSESLLGNGISSPPHLGLYGVSKGALLVSAMMIRRPDLFNAVVMAYPFVDFDWVSRHKRLIQEYGDVYNRKLYKSLIQYSTRHALKRDANYSPPLIVASAADTNTRPQQARRLAAKMRALGYDFFYYEQTKGDHRLPFDEDSDEAARALSVIYSYLWQRLR